MNDGSIQAIALVADALATIQVHTPFGGWLQTWQGDGDGLYHAAIEGSDADSMFVAGRDARVLWGVGPNMLAAIVALAIACRDRGVLPPDRAPVRRFGRRDLPPRQREREGA